MKSNDFVVKGYSRVRKFLFPVHLICIGSIKQIESGKTYMCRCFLLVRCGQLTMRFNPMVKMRL